MAININYNLDPTRTLPKVDEVSSTEAYFGYAPVGTKEDDSKWKIIKMLKSGNVTTFMYANGDESLLTKWSDRASTVFSR